MTWRCLLGVGCVVFSTARLCADGGDGVERDVSKMTPEAIGARIAELQAALKDGHATAVELALFEARAGALEEVELEPLMTDDEISIARETRRLGTHSKSAALSSLLMEMDADPHPTLDYIAGTLYMEREDWQSAAKCFGNALRKYPNFLKARRSLATVLVKLQRWSEAKEQLLAAYALEKEPTDMVNGLLGLCYLQQKEYATATLYYQAAVDIAAKREWRSGLAQSLLGQRRFAEAIPVLESLRAEELALVRPSYEDGPTPSLDANPQPIDLQVSFAAPRGDSGSGYVVAEFMVTFRGEAIDARVIESSDPKFEQTTLDAIRASKWIPAKSAGKQVSVRVRQRFEFKGENPGAPSIEAPVE